jgi:hypothetical protein
MKVGLRRCTQMIGRVDGASKPKFVKKKEARGAKGLKEHQMDYFYDDTRT